MICFGAGSLLEISKSMFFFVAHPRRSNGLFSISGPCWRPWHGRAFGSVCTGIANSFSRKLRRDGSDDLHPCRGGDRGARQECEQAHAPQELRNRRASAPHRVRELAPNRLQRHDNTVRYEASPEAVERFERRLRRCGAGKERNVVANLATIPGTSTF